MNAIQWQALREELLSIANDNTQSRERRNKAKEALDKGWGTSGGMAADTPFIDTHAPTPHTRGDDVETLDRDYDGA